MAETDINKRPTFVRMNTLDNEQPSSSSQARFSPAEETQKATFVVAEEDDKDAAEKIVDDGASESSDKPSGVRYMEGITSSWSKEWLYVAYVLIWLIYFTDSLQQQSNYSWTPYVTSAFLEHGLTATTQVVANIITGMIKFPLAKYIDIIGRSSGFLIALTFAVLALVLMAVCANVETYAAAQVFYWTGLNSMMYIMNMFINDTSKLRNRQIALAFSSTPFICNTFAGPALAQEFLDHSTWRWGYGAFAIITPVMCAPFLTVLTLLIRRAKKQNAMPKKASGRSFPESIRYYAIEFDVVGLLLICSGFSLFLLPFSLAANQSKGWASPMIICMIIFGIVTLGLFAIWERFFAPKTVIPFHLLLNRGLICACLIDANLFLATSIYTSYFTSYLQVVFQLSVSRAGWVSNIYNLVSCSWGVVLAFALRYTDRYKWAAVVSVPGQILFTGLLILFRTPDTPLGLVIMADIFQSIFTASLIISAGIGLQASVPHENLAVAIALQGMITSIGQAIGNTVSGAMWTQLLPMHLAQHLPEDLQGQERLIYGNLTLQTTYPWDSPARQAIVTAYGETYKWMLVGGTCLLAPVGIWAVLLKNYRLSEHKNLKGTLF